MNWGDDLKRAYEHQLKGFAEGNDNHYLLASIDAVEQINSDGENFQAVLDNLNKKIEKIDQIGLEQAMQADRFNTSRNYKNAYEVRCDESWYNHGLFFGRPRLTDQELLEKIEREQRQNNFNSSSRDNYRFRNG